MKICLSFRRWAPVLALSAIAVHPAGVAAYGQAPQAAVQASLDKAHQLELHGRLDLAAQAWQQVLLADPKNTEALGGLARASKASGNLPLATLYMERLRAINPNDPGIMRAEATVTQEDTNKQLKEAERLAQQGQYVQSMQIYRKLYGDTPPPGDLAMSYYETEAATEEGRPHAIAGLRALAARFPGDPRYQVALGRILTYNPKTRPEGRKLLEAHPNDPQAVEALRQSLLWDAQNPATAGEIRAYLAQHPDAQLTQILRDEPKGGVHAKAPARTLTPEQRAAAQLAATRSAENRAAYSQLNAGRLEPAEDQFKAILATKPDDPNALAGMGYIRMAQANFAGALNFLVQAREDGSKDPGLGNAIATSQFWNTMEQGATALDANDLLGAEREYRIALTLRPTSAEALEALGGTLLRAQQPAAAEPFFARFVQLKPTAMHAWRGLFLAQSQAGETAAALQTERRFPSSVRAEVMKDPLFLRVLASTYAAAGRDAEAQQVLKAALDLPFPSDASAMASDTQMQYAALLAQANRNTQAAGLYRNILTREPNNVGAWQGLVRTQHAMGEDAQALQTIEAVPPPVYEKAMHDAGFESTVAAVYQAEQRLDVAQAILEKAIARQLESGQRASISNEVQLAGIYLQRNEAQKALPIYQQVLAESPDRIDAWKGVLAVLHTTGRDTEALSQVRQIPAATRSLLEQDPDYLQTIGGIYSQLGDPQQAQVFLARERQIYADEHRLPPADIDIQNGWMAYNAGDDASLYAQLMALGARGDLTTAQRRTVQTIWANWALRRANQAATAGNNRRALAILNATAQAFPDNPGVTKALAGGYARAGMPKQAVLIWKAQNMSTASAVDYRAAIGAALADNDSKDAETWLRFALSQYPNDAELLNLAAKFEESRGDTRRAVEYYRASLHALPPDDANAELTDSLGHPPTAGGRPLPGAGAGQDLAALLRPTANDAPETPSTMQKPGQPYLPGPGAAVPDYMSAPDPLPQTAPGGVPKTHLRDYVPQAEVDELLPPEATTPPGITLAGRTALVLTPSVYQHQQVVKATQRAEQKSLDAPPPQPAAQLAQMHAPATIKTPPQQTTGRTPLLTLEPVSPPQQGTTPQQQAPQQATTAQQGTVAEQGQPGVIYGPYVPYQPPAIAPTPPPANSVRLGETPPVRQFPAPPVTDVLPTARYVPATPRNKPAPAVHPEANAANAAAKRRAAASGQSKPPVEDYSVTSPDVQTGAPPGQVAQPGTSSGSNSGGFGQQYPQPRTGTVAHGRARPHPAVKKPAPAPIVEAASETPAPAPAAPAYPSLSYPGVGQPLTGQPYPSNARSTPTDDDLMAQRIPGLGGRYAGGIDPQVPLTQRQQTERDLAILEGGYSGWMGGTVSARYRSGTPGLDRLTDIEAGAEGSMTVGDRIRFTIVPTSVFLDSGVFDVTPYQGSTSGYPVIGTYPGNATVSPPQQSQSGIGGELQLATRNFAAAVGYTPYEFLVSNITGRVLYRPNAHLTFFGDRSAVVETELSYAGLRDPGTLQQANGGNVWGGVVATGGGVRFDGGDGKAGFYVSADGADLTGTHVLGNYKFEGSAGAYFLAHDFHGYGRLNVGASVFGMHYNYNERGLTYGLGGYFSPAAYVVASVPLTFAGHYGNAFHYSIAASAGVQAFEEASQIYFPLDPALQNAFAASCTVTQLANRACAASPSTSSAGGNYSVNAEGAYRFAMHWYMGGFLTANNTNNYNTVTGGFFVRYAFRPQYGKDDYPTGLFPVEGFRSLRVP